MKTRIQRLTEYFDEDEVLANGKGGGYQIVVSLDRGDHIGLTPEEVKEERIARGEDANGRKRKRGHRPDSRRAPPVKNPFDEVLKSLGLWDRVSAVCKEHGVAVCEIGGDSKARRLHITRRKVYQMLKELGWSNVDVGKLFDKHPSTILDALK